MSRYRPPAAPKSPLITPEGYKVLQDELDYLWRVKRPEITRSVSEAAAQGDRSENAEYIYGKKRLREIDKRLQYLSILLKDPKIIDRSMVNTSLVNFGCRVLVKDENEVIKSFTIVGRGEADIKDRTISSEAPVAKALLGKAVGDIVEVELERGIIEYEIVKIEIGDID